jgi:dipeptidyl-peptidase 4
MKIAFGFGLLLCLPVQAADFDRALSLPKRTENLVFRDRLKPTWLPDGKAFWYRILTGPETHEFVLIDADTGERKTAPDLPSLRLPDSGPLKASETTIEPRKSSRTGESSWLKLINQLDTDVELFWIDQKGGHNRYGGIRAGGEREQHTYEGHVWLVTSLAGEHLAVMIPRHSWSATRRKRRGAG